jgi:hypothetical protein
MAFVFPGLIDDDLGIFWIHEILARKRGLREKRNKEVTG